MFLLLVFVSIVFFLVFSPHFPFSFHVQGGNQPNMMMLGRAPVCFIPFNEMDDIGFYLNILMTMPFGVFLFLFSNKKFHFRYILLAGVFIGLFIETCQFILDNVIHFFIRYVDINDVISNALGFVLGYYLSILCVKILKKKFNKKR